MIWRGSSPATSPGPSTSTFFCTGATAPARRLTRAATASRAYAGTPSPSVSGSGNDAARPRRIHGRNAYFGAPATSAPRLVCLHDENRRTTAEPVDLLPKLGLRLGRSRAGHRAERRRVDERAGRGRERHERRAAQPAPRLVAPQRARRRRPEPDGVCEDDVEPGSNGRRLVDRPVGAEHDLLVAEVRARRRTVDDAVLVDRGAGHEPLERRA